MGTVSSTNITLHLDIPKAFKHSNKRQTVRERKTHSFAEIFVLWKIATVRTLFQGFSRRSGLQMSYTAPWAQRAQNQAQDSFSFFYKN